MKRIPVLILVLIAAAATAAGGWYAYQRESGGSAGGARPLLTYVPADTDYYFGYSEAYPAADYAMLWQGMLPANNDDNLPDPAKASEKAGPAAGMLVALYRMQIEATHAGEPFARFGLDGSGIGAFYEVDGLPVVRRRVADPEAFWQALDEAVSRAGGAGGGGREGERRYPFKAAESGTPPEMVVTVRDGYAIASLAVESMADTLPAALGDEAPAKSLADGDRLANLAERHGTLPWATGFIEHAAIGQAFTGEADSGLGRLIGALARAYGEEPPRGDDACSSDVEAMTQVWPRSVVGLTALDTDNGNASVRWAVPITDESLTETLMRLRGHVPAAAEGGVASFGIGLNMGELLPVLQTLAGRFTAAAFECPALKTLQTQVAQGDLSSLGMVTAMLRDVRGAALTLLSPGGDGEPPNGIVEIATPQPMALWSMASGFLGATEPPQVGGPPVALQSPMHPGQSLRVALRDDRIIVLSGEGVNPPAAVEGDEGESLAANGLLELHYNLAQASEFLGAVDSLPGGGAAQANQEELEELRETLGRMDVNYGMKLDVTGEGIRYDISLAPGESG